MKAAKIIIQNILGIKDLEIIPGKITELRGKNGTGKTSALTAIRSALKGGNQAELLRKGEEKGEIVLVLDNGMRIDKTITADETKVKLTHPEHGNVSSPAKMIAGLADALSVNPVEFLTADPKDRVDILLEAMPLKIDAGLMKEMVGSFSFIEMGALKADDHALKVLDTAHKAAFNRRQDVNRSAKEKRNTVEQLGSGLEKPKRPLAEIKSEILKLTDEANLAAKELEDRRRDLREAKYSETQKVQDWRELEIQKIRDEAERQLADVMQKHGGRDSKIDELLASITGQNETIKDLNRQVEGAQKATGALEAVDRMEKEAERLETSATALTEVIKQIEQAKIDLLKDLPIKGIEIKDGKILVDGVDFEHVNTARRVQIAVQIAQIRAKQLGLICIDNMEALDAESFAALEAELAKTDLQLITTRVSDSEFAVVTK